MRDPWNSNRVNLMLNRQQESKKERALRKSVGSVVRNQWKMVRGTSRAVRLSRGDQAALKEGKEIIRRLKRQKSMAQAKQACESLLFRVRVSVKDLINRIGSQVPIPGGHKRIRAEVETAVPAASTSRFRLGGSKPLRFISVKSPMEDPMIEDNSVSRNATEKYRWREAKIPKYKVD